MGCIGLPEWIQGGYHFCDHYSPATTRFAATLSQYAATCRGCPMHVGEPGHGHNPTPSAHPHPAPIATLPTPTRPPIRDVSGGGPLAVSGPDFGRRGKARRNRAGKSCFSATFGLASALSFV